MQNRNETKQISEWILAGRPSETLSAAIYGYIYDYAKCISGMMAELKITPNHENVMMTAEEFFVLADSYLNTKLPSETDSLAGLPALRLQQSVRQKCQVLSAEQPGGLSGRLQAYLDLEQGFMQRIGLVSQKVNHHAGQC